ncbi:small neutral amino acid transporter SnatA (MarC family) [Pseudomonas frederiksbergensis]|uniref:hypothetical protein n=1 Tax=Pseudomonas TaxID=286 RepID=UPI003D1ACAAA
MEITKEQLEALKKEIEANLGDESQMSALAANTSFLCANREVITTFAVSIAKAWVGAGGAILVKMGIDWWYSNNCK